MKLVHRFRVWMLLFGLCFGQMAMLAHATDPHDADESQHVCLTCLATHDLGGGPPPAAAASRVVAAACPFLPPLATSPLTIESVASRFARGPPRT